MSKELTSQKYWDSVHRDRDSLSRGSFRFKRALARVVFGRKHSWRRGLLVDYSMFRIQQLLRAIGLKGTSRKLLEIGSAPGGRLAYLSKELQCEPYGVEYSKEGVRACREVLSRAGHSTENIVEADFFDRDFQERYRDQFDLVCSFGFVEHFSKPEEVVAAHLPLLKVGGVLLVTIPNKRGLNRMISRLFCDDTEERHNMEVMRLESFSKLFLNHPLQVEYCGYMGVFKFTQFSLNRAGLAPFFWRCFRRLQLPWNLFQRLAFRSKSPEFSMTSPYLVFIGRKIG